MGEVAFGPGVLVGRGAFEGQHAQDLAQALGISGVMQSDQLGTGFLHKPLLLDCGASIDARDQKGCTPLQRAINCRRHEIARFLADRGASVS